MAVVSFLFDRLEVVELLDDLLDLDFLDCLDCCLDLLEYPDTLLCLSVSESNCEVPVPLW